MNTNYSNPSGVTAIDEHLHLDKPADFALMERIINEKMAGKFPFFSCKFSPNIAHSIYIALSTEPREKWTNGYFENTDKFTAHIFSSLQWHKEGAMLSFDPSQCSRIFKNKPRAKKERDPQKMVEYVCRQLEKLLLNPQN